LVRLLCSFATLLFALGGVTGVVAAEIKVFISVDQAVLDAFVPAFERESGHKVLVVPDHAALLQKRLDAGENFDVAILTAAIADDFIKSGKIIVGSRADVARSGIGVATSAQNAKPDISTRNQFKKALLNAASIGYVNPALGGAAGVHVGRLLDRLGIAGEVKSKTKLAQYPMALVESVAKGEIELGMTQIQFILPVSGAALVGPLPKDLQMVTVFTAGVLTTSKEPKAADALIKFLTAPAASPILQAKGFEPG
jgi:molybdate transport system substrate-binding protein